MILQEFVENNIGRGRDFDGAYGVQCVDLVQYYNREVVGGARFWGNAKDIINQDGGGAYTIIKNVLGDVNQFPKAGSIAVFGPSYGGGVGHVGLVTSADGNTLTLLQCNDPLGSMPHMTTYGYRGLLGWLEPKNLDQIAPAAMHVGTRKVKVLVSTLNVRNAPRLTAATAQGNTHDGNLHAGDEPDVLQLVTGDQYTLNGIVSNQWWETVFHNFIAAAGTKGL